MTRLASGVCVASLALASAQQPGAQKDNKHPSFTTSTCDAAGVCTAAQKSVVLDSNWMWVHKTGTYQPNCFDDNKWNAQMCPDPTTCAAGCGEMYCSEVCRAACAWWRLLSSSCSQPCKSLNRPHAAALHAM